MQLVRCFNFSASPCKNFGVDFHNCNHVFLLYDASAVPDIVSVNLSAEGGVLNVSLWEKLGNDIQVTGYLISGHSDALNPCHL
jgi:hypothetical protein